MSTTYYSLYVQKVMAMAKTMVIKSDATAQAINTDLVGTGRAVDSDFPETWKYYLNLNGQYHATDKEMTVISLDTLETIVFSKENLRTHRATARNYAYGSKYYNDLVARFPDQETLILGILNPVDLTHAVEASEGTILYADKNLIEGQETNLLEKLQGYIDRFLVRWSVDAYRLTDDLYVPAQLGVLYLNLPLWILNIRLENCKTQYAHSFHIREYLASHNRLDKYIEQLTIKQQLWLYRNILYIENNAGKQETFDWLVENIVTERGIPLAQYVMRHNLEEMPDHIYPEVEFKRSAVNRHYSPGVTEVRNLLTVLEDENDLARRNPVVLDRTHRDTTQRFKNALHTKLPTKALDSSITDLTDSGAITFSDFLMNHWLYWASTNRYQSVLTVTHPKTGDYFQIPVRDAFITYLYCYNQSMGQSLEIIPDIMALEVRKDRVPRPENLWPLVERRYIKDHHIEKALDDNPPVLTYISVDAFKDAVEAIYDRANEHRMEYVVEEHQVVRGQVQAITDHFYMDVPVTLVKGDEVRDYEVWFKDKGYDFPELTRLEHGLLAASLVQAATGLDLTNRRSLKEMQGAMLKLMGQLSSYSVQFIQNINAGPILVADDPTQRLGDEWVKGTGGWAADIVGPGVMNITGRGNQTWHLDTDVMTDLNLSMQLRHREYFDPTVDYSLHSRTTFEHRVEGFQVGINFVDPDPDHWNIVIV